MKKAVILFSGGLDSTTVLAYAKNKGFECYPLSFSYGQRHSVELEFAKKIARHFNVEHKIVSLPGDLFANSSLTNQEMQVPEFNQSDKRVIPSTYVPARNTIFLSIALGFAETIGAQTIGLGVSAIDYSGYPDCRPEYIKAFETMANLATKKAVEHEGEKLVIETPLIYLTKAQTIQLGVENGVDYSMTISCYSAEPSTGAACGKCDSCAYRKLGFKNAGIADPTRYRAA